MRARRSSGSAFVLLALTLPACGDGADAPRAAVDVFLDADPCSAEAADEIAVTVLDESGAPVETITASLGGASPEAELPTGLRVAAGEQLDASFRVVAELRAQGVPVSRVSARAQHAPDELGELRLLFDDACLGIECGEDRTCIEGSCVDDRAPPPVSAHPAPASCPPIVYVDPTLGSDVADCGAIDAPCASIEHAVVQRSTGGSGAVVNVRGERTYTSDAVDLVNIGVDQSGSARSPLVIRAWPGTGRPLLDGRGVCRKVLDLSGTHMVIQGLEVTGGSEHGITMNGPENRFITIRDVVAHGNGSGPSMFDNRAAVNVNNGGTDLLIEGCELRDNHSAVSGESTGGIHVNEGTRVTIRNNRIGGNDQGVYVNASSDIRIEGNTLVANARRAIDASGGHEIVRNRICGGEGGIRMRPATIAATVENNSVVDATLAAIELVDRPGTIVRANIVAFSETGILVTGEVGDDSHNLYFENGTDFSGLTPSLPDTDVFADPLFVDRARCDLDVMEGSRALSAGPEGGPIGAL